MAPPAVILVRLVAVHMTCDLCHASARIQSHNDPFSRHLDPLCRWLGSHLAPRLVSAEIQINGSPRTVPAANFDRR